MSETSLVEIANSAVTLNPGDEWLMSRNEAIASLKTITDVNDETSFAQATKFDTAAKKLVKKLSEMRLAETRKIDAFKKQIITYEAELAKPLQTEIDRVDKMATVYFAEQARKREEEERAAAEAARKEAEAQAAPVNPFDKFAPTTPTPAAPEVVTAIPKSDAARGVKTFTFKIVDPTLVPREFCTPDERLIRAYVQMQKAATGGNIEAVKQIPGVIISVEHKIRSR